MCLIHSSDIVILNVRWLDGILHTGISGTLIFSILCRHYVELCRNLNYYIKVFALLTLNICLSLISKLHSSGRNVTGINMW